jgi:hypothetical protein
MNIKIIAALIVAVFLAGTHWKAYVSGKATESTKWNMKTIKANDDARELERLNRQSKEKALESQKRELVANTTAAARAAESAIRLLNASERSLQASRENHAACIVSADTHAQLLLSLIHI